MARGLRRAGCRSRHDPKPVRAHAGVESAGDQGEVRGGAADTNRAVERLRRPFEARRHDPGEQPHAGEMQERKMFQIC